MIRRLTCFLVLTLSPIWAEEPKLTPHIPADPHLRSQREVLFDQLRAKPYRIESDLVLKALLATPREEFMLTNNRQHAYRNTPMPIRFGQTISQPYIVALMTEQLDPKPDHRVLEIGTGSGYQAAVLSPLVAEVFSIEIVKPLAKEAEERLKKLGYDNVSIKAGDGYAGWADHAPFDSVIVTCAPTAIPQPLIDQLKEGGRMIIPVGDFGSQELVLLEKKDGKIAKTKVLSVFFVPMTGEAAKP